MRATGAAIKFRLRHRLEALHGRPPASLPSKLQPGTALSAEQTHTIMFNTAADSYGTAVFRPGSDMIVAVNKCFLA